MSRPVLYLEPVGGVAGDMFLAAALDLGVELSALEEALRGLAVGGYRLRVSRAERHAITGTHLEVLVAEPEHGHHHRSLREIRSLIEGAASLPPRAKQRALAVFETIGEAEARIHGVPVETIHFHEVGAVDSIVDICGAAMVLELLGDPEVFSAPPPLGSGMVKSAHGNIPVPAPATLEILKDVPVRFEGMGELTTPTGAALLKAFARIGSPPPMRIERVGYGVGTKDFPDRANVLRASLGRSTAHSVDSTYVVEANLDDCSPQLLGALVEGLIQQGAHDAYVVPAMMKKSRPGHLLAVVVPGDKREHIIATLLTESTTLGVRTHSVERSMLERRFQTVSTRWGSVRVKLGLRGEEVLNAHPEFEECRRLAEAHQVPLKQVMAEALAAFHQAGKSAPK